MTRIALPPTYPPRSAAQGAEAAGSAKSDKVYAMVAGMKSRGVPIDGVGLQMHISVDEYPAASDVAANIARLGKLGLDVHITEVGVPRGTRHVVSHPSFPPSRIPAADGRGVQAPLRR